MATTTGQLQSSRLITIDAGAALADAAALLQRERVSHLLVTERGSLRGVLCTCDVERAVLGSAVRQTMSAKIYTIEDDAPAEHALAQMRSLGVHCLPVLRGHEVTGMITMHDLIRAGFGDGGEERCSACGSDEHVRCAEHGRSLDLCLDCARRSQPPGPLDELGGGS